MRLSKEYQPLSSIIDKTLMDRRIAHRLKEAAALLIWDDVVGQKISEATEVENVRDGILFVKTKSPAWSNELAFYKKEIISKLNDKLQENVIKDVRFIAGHIVRNRTKPFTPQDDDSSELDSITLSDEEIRFIEETASSAGPASADIKSTMEAALKLNKWRLLHGWTPCKVCGCLQNEPSGVCAYCSLKNE